jgi:hypothetical protein
MTLHAKFLLLVLLGIVGIVIILYYYYYGFFDSDNGKLYPSKALLCQEFALSYLRTIPTAEDNFDNQKWVMAVDVATELHNLCLLDLNVEGFASFESTLLNKYKE